VSGPETGIELVPRFAVRDDELSALHHLAFHPDEPPGPAGVRPWARRLAGHSLTWVGAFRSGELVGFAHAVWDGGAHAFVLDTVVHPAVRRRGVGRDLVRAVTAAAFAAGCEWVHVDYEPHNTRFYQDACGFRPTPAGLRHRDD
jgi:GNAT superfamily N-acetyltransferase